MNYNAIVCADSGPVARVGVYYTLHQQQASLADYLRTSDSNKIQANKHASNEGWLERNSCNTFPKTIM